MREPLDSTKVYCMSVINACVCAPSMPLPNHAPTTPSQALIDAAAIEGWLSTALRVMHLVQMCVQARWLSDSSLLSLPHLEQPLLPELGSALAHGPRGGRGIEAVACLPELLAACERDGKFLANALRKFLSAQQITQVGMHH